MTPQTPVASTVVPPKEAVDEETRERIRAWLKSYKDSREWTNERLADELGLSEPTVTNILNGKRGAGLDVLIKMHRRLGRSADDILDAWPPGDPRGKKAGGR